MNKTKYDQGNKVEEKRRKEETRITEDGADWKLYLCQSLKVDTHRN
jgi:hypothetical protein